MGNEHEARTQYEKQAEIFDSIRSHLKITEGKTIFQFLGHLTDSGNAERFAYFARNEARYCDPFKKWLLYDGKRWKADDHNAVTVKAKNIVRKLYSELEFVENSRERSEIAAHLSKSENKTAITNCLSLAHGELPIVPESLDRDKFLLNLDNGTYDLKALEIRDYDPDDYITKIAPVSHDPKAVCPMWDAFLDRVMGGDPELVYFLQKCVGYSLTGDTSEQCLFILYGEGQNGKSTFLETVSAMIGDYAQQTPVETLMIKRNDSISNDIARLQGARFVAAIEVEEGKRLAESLIKQMTGGDRITARFLHAEYFEFVPEFKLWLGTNHKPVIRGTDFAIWRRIRLIPFTVKIPPEEIDLDLGEKLKTELPGILNWALAGYHAWKNEGLKPPEAVTVASEGYRAEMDVLSAFLDDRCIIDRAAMVKNSELYSAYVEWAEETGEFKKSSRKLNAALVERGFDSIKQKNGIHWIGIGLK